MSENELYHYGIKGMRWGVRRDARILANHRHNRTVMQLENDYAFGRIGSKRYQKGLKEAKVTKKQTLSDIKKRYKDAATDEEREQISKNITKITSDEVSNVTIKRGAAAVNQMLGVINIAGVVGTAANAAIINPAFAGAYISAGGVAIAAETGWRYMTQRYLDKKS